MAVVAQAGIKLIDPRRGLVYVDRRRARRDLRRSRVVAVLLRLRPGAARRATRSRARVWPALVWLAVKVGALSYGGGYVIIPLMRGDAQRSG